MEIKMELSKEQILAIKKALDLYSRVLCGQVEEVARVIERTDFSKSYTAEQRKQARTGADLIKQSLFSEIYPVTYGIASEGRLPEKAAVAYDIYQVMQNFAVEFILNASTAKSDVFKTAKEDIPIITLC